MNADIQRHEADDYEILPAGDVDPSQIVATLATAFERRWDDDWYRWKHVHGAWGPSIGFVALDDTGIIGVRLALPWRLDLGGITRIGHRAVEAATLPRARGRGVFGALTRATMDLLARSSSSPLVLSTPNDLSRSTHVRLGWSQVGSIEHRAMLVPPARGRLGLSELSLDSLPASEPLPDRIATAWSSDALRWRFSSATGYDYRAVRLREAATDCGVVFRRGRAKGMPALVVVHGWGSQDGRHAIVRALVREERAVFVVGAVGQGAAPVIQARGVSSGASTVTAWQPHTADSPWPVDRMSAWALGLSDLEGVI